jgi:hypothetical protein
LFCVLCLCENKQRLVPLHTLIGFYNRDEKCLQRATDWGFNNSSLNLEFKGLISIICHYKTPVVVSHNKPKHRYKLMLTAHSTINILFVIPNNLLLVSSANLCNYERQLVATVWRQYTGGNINGSSNQMCITFGLILFCRRRSKEYYGMRSLMISTAHPILFGT